MLIAGSPRWGPEDAGPGRLLFFPAHRPAAHRPGLAARLAPALRSHRHRHRDRLGHRPPGLLLRHQQPAVRPPTRRRRPRPGPSSGSWPGPAARSPSSALSPARPLPWAAAARDPPPPSTSSPPPPRSPSRLPPRRRCALRPSLPISPLSRSTQRARQGLPPHFQPAAANRPSRRPEDDQAPEVDRYPLSPSPRACTPLSRRRITRHAIHCNNCI